MDFHVIIPARYDSTRFPGKVLSEIAGKPMIQHVYERSVASGATTVVIATDDRRVVKVAESFGAKVCITASHHQSGTERVSEAVLLLDFDDEDVIVNVQADEPLIPPTIIRQLAVDLIENEHVKVSTICQQLKDIKDLFNPNIVKVVMNRRNYAMYFSRAPIPWDHKHFGETEKLTQYSFQKHWQHIGLFAYRVDFLKEYIEWSSCPLEEIETLEQLRILWNAVRVHMVLTDHTILPGVNTKEDLERVQQYVKDHGVKM